MVPMGPIRQNPLHELEQCTACLLHTRSRGHPPLPPAPLQQWVEEGQGSASSLPDTVLPRSR